MKPDDSSLALAQRLDVKAALGTVTARTQLSPSLVEIDLSTDVTLAGEPGNDVMVRVPFNDAYTRRRYSIRSIDEASGTIRLWIHTAHDGPGAHWATGASIGSAVDLVGPRGKITINHDADWTLFVGDTATLASAYRMAGAIELPGRAIFLIEVDHIDDAITAPFDEQLGVTGIFVERRGRATNDASGLLAGLAALELPKGDGQAYLFGEFAINKALKHALLERGLPNDAISSKAFYRNGQINRENGEPDKSD